MKLNVTIERKPDSGDAVEVTMAYGIGGWFSVVFSGYADHDTWLRINDRSDDAVMAWRRERDGEAIHSETPITLTFDNATEFMPLMTAISATALAMQALPSGEVAGYVER